MPIKILLIDDEEELVELYQMKLEDHNHNTYCAYSGNQAVEFLKENSVDLIMCDINMPDGNGLVVLSYYLEHKLPYHFCFVTGHAKGSPELKDAEASGVKIFNKPLNWEDMWMLISSIENQNKFTTDPTIQRGAESAPLKKNNNSPKDKASSAKSTNDPKLSALEQRGMDLIRSINARKK